MVMPNRHDGASSPEWWDDLPPEVKRRVSPPRDDDSELATDRGAARLDPERPSYRPALMGDLSRLAVLFLAVLIANVVFLLIALSFLVDKPGPAD